jgi:hypothetical protein
MILYVEGGFRRFRKIVARFVFFSQIEGSRLISTRESWFRETIGGIKSDSMSNFGFIL